MYNGSAGMVSGRIPQGPLLEAIQRGDSFIYAILTREGAVKFGVTTNLASRKGSIRFGGTKRILAYTPGEYADEQDLHASLADHRIYGTREYYYPNPEVRAVVDAMRANMGVKKLSHAALPRLFDCTFHARVMRAQNQGGSSF